MIGLQLTPAPDASRKIPSGNNGRVAAQINRTIILDINTLRIIAKGVDRQCICFQRGHAINRLTGQVINLNGITVKTIRL
ncbi:hypothetical protein [Pantoea agglomerans]|uniref:hypothetical protein n=1 Tax=Enterobacter agglomerans TaxID=549 RepID=UPI0018C85F0F|nr:hypothetical protein [Pantoea agglomerans]WHU90454.1 hypothetical protein A7P62_22450 [Pantoea agglomerans pv. gypsophilae]